MFAGMREIQMVRMLTLDMMLKDKPSLGSKAASFGICILTFLFAEVVFGKSPALLQFLLDAVYR